MVRLLYAMSTQEFVVEPSNLFDIPVNAEMVLEALPPLPTHLGPPRLRDAQFPHRHQEGVGITRID